MNFYVYTYLINGEPQYVGKGKGTRALKHLSSKAKTLWVNHLRKAQRESVPVVVAMQFFETEEAAFFEEVRLIALYGRRDLGTGTLYNLTDGGEGSSGAKPGRMSDAQRARISAALTGLQGVNTGRTLDQTWRAHITAGMTGKTKSQDHRRKIGEAVARTKAAKRAAIQGAKNA